MRFWKRDYLEERLRRMRPVPTEGFVDRLAARIEGREAYRRPRVAVAIALTALLVGSLAAFGGVGYAAKAAGDAYSATRGSSGDDIHGGQGQGCTPGYWKQSQHFDSWPFDVSPNQTFASLFGTTVPGQPANLTLLQALGLTGNTVNRLASQAVAAYLNARTLPQNYPYSPSQVITETRNALLSGDKTLIEQTKDKWDAANNLNCPLI